ncbi:glutathione hydrolase 5 proenzyme-like isoform X2 [Eucyclogobius newberryi]
MLQRGGSAVDGAIAALLCTSVVNPQSMGLGGGAIFTVMNSSGDVQIISSRETVPKLFKPDLLKSCPKKFRFMSGPEWIGVPGEIRGYELAHRLYGKLPWATLFQPTIKLAREGLQISPLLEKYIPVINKSLSVYKLFSDANGKPLTTGDIIKFEKLADTLEVIANYGANAFYSGTIAKDLISDIQEAGGTLTLQDLASFRASQSDAWVFPFQDFEVYIPPPPAGGALLALLLNIMKGYKSDANEKTLAYHRYIEAFKFVNGLRKYIHDPNITPDKITKSFIQDRFADHIRTLISDRTHGEKYYNLTSYLDSMGTTHMSVLAEDGSAVSVTSTINHLFGSQILSPKTGIILNNQISDFCGRTEIHAGEQPPSSVSPAVLKSQSRMLLIGASGGSFITTGIASTLMNHLFFGKSLKEAIESPVVFVNSVNQPQFEEKFDQKIIDGLIAFGHKYDPKKMVFFNVVNAVEKDGDCICAVSDARKMGKAAGY